MKLPLKRWCLPYLSYLLLSSQSHPSTGRLLGGKFPGSPSYFPSIFTKLQHFFPQCSPISYHFPTVPNDFSAGFCVSEVDASCAARSNCTRHLGYHGGSRHRCGSVSLEKWWFETTISWEFIVDIADFMTVYVSKFGSHNSNFTRVCGRYIIPTPLT